MNCFRITKVASYPFFLVISTLSLPRFDGSRSDACLSFQVEDDALTNIGAMISNAFEIVRDPEPVGHTLHDACILLQCRNGVDIVQHRHDVLADQVVTHIDYIVLMPDSARCMCVAQFKGCIASAGI